MSNNVPQIRFKGFDGEWEKRIFSSLMSHLSNNTLSRAELNYSQGEMQDVHYGDILVKFGEILDARKESLPYFNDSTVAQKFEKASLKDGDIIIADTAEDETAGKCVELIGVGENKISAGLHTMPCRPNQKFSPRYLGYYMNSPAYHNQLFKYMQGTKVVSISKSALSETIIRNPSNAKEQSKIGSYFEQLDALIDGKQKKLEKLKNLKKAYQDKMFPKKGSKVPEVRFKGFSGDWEKQELGEIGKTYTGLAGKGKADFGHGDARYVTYMNVFSNPVASLKMLDSIELDSNQNEVRKGDLFFTVSSETPEEVGMSSVWVHDEPNVYLNSFCFGFRPNIECDSFYLAYLMRSSVERSQIILLAQGISRFNISKNKMMNIKVLLPSLPEQQKIGVFFQNLDNLIALQQQELEKLKNIKSACLQKMFV